MKLSELSTPALILDRPRLERNCERMATRMAGHGVSLRPHLKTAKSAAVAARATADQFGGITVSTLAEAGYFLAHGYKDITYAVGMTDRKLGEVARLHREGAQLRLLTDNVPTVVALGKGAEDLSVDLELLIEVDTGGLRGGVAPDDDELLAIAQAIDDNRRLLLAGVLTHAGHSYSCQGAQAVAAVAEQERAGVTRAAERLRQAGFSCPTVSAGSTPTAVHARSLEGVTEMRPGVYVFFDLDQVGIGACRQDDIALSVLATVIGHNPRAGRILIDAGALALSKDVSAQAFMDKVGYGRVCGAEDLRPIAGLYVAEVHQEHGLLAAATGTPPYELLPPGAQVRILPNHACITAAAHDRYFVVEEGDTIVDEWDRINGW